MAKILQASTVSPCGGGIIIMRAGKMNKMASLMSRSFCIASSLRLEIDGVPEASPLAAGIYAQSKQTARLFADSTMKDER
jgi:hypothetical protein